MTGQRVAYVRISTLDQNPVRQLDGVKVDQTFTDTASGKDRDRPELRRLINYVRKGDLVLVHSMDRLSRSLDDLRLTIRELNDKGVHVEFARENLVFTGADDAQATLMLNITGAFADFERSLIRERQREGIALAKKRGVYRGRGRALDAEQANDLCELAEAGVPKAALARQFGISRETVYTYLRASGPDTLT